MRGDDEGETLRTASFPDKAAVAEGGEEAHKEEEGIALFDL